MAISKKLGTIQEELEDILYRDSILDWSKKELIEEITNMLAVV